MKQENMTHIEREILAKITHEWQIRVSRQTHWNSDYNCFPHVNKLEKVWICKIKTRYGKNDPNRTFKDENQNVWDKTHTMGWNSDEMSRKKISEIWNVVPRQKYTSSSKVVERRK